MSQPTTVTDDNDSPCYRQADLTYREHSVESHGQIAVGEEMLAEVEELVAQDNIHQVELGNGQHQAHELR